MENQLVILEVQWENGLRGALVTRNAILDPEPALVLGKNALECQYHCAILEPAQRWRQLHRPQAHALVNVVGQNTKVTATVMIITIIVVATTMEVIVVENQENYRSLNTVKYASVWIPGT